MKLSRAQVLIMLLFHFGATFEENREFEITRYMPGDWIEGAIDSIQIPKSVCDQEINGYGNFCNTSCIKLVEGGTEGPYSCQCSDDNATVTYLNNTGWRCLSNQQSRSELGCTVNNLLEGEAVDGRIRTLSTGVKWTTIATRNNDGICSIHMSSSWYIGCFGEKIPLATMDIFLFSIEGGHYKIEIKDTQPTNDTFRGRIINLGITCSKGPNQEGCLLFKLHGTLLCPVERSTTPIFSMSTTILTPTASSSSTRTLMASSGLSLAISPTQIYSETATVVIPTDLEIGSTQMTFKTATGLTISPTQVYSGKSTVSISTKNGSTQVYSETESTVSISTKIAPTQTNTRSSSGKKGKNEGSSSSLGIIAGVTAFVTLVLLLIAALFICRRRKSRKDARSIGSGHIDKKTVASTNPAFQMEEQNGFVTNHDRENPIAPVYSTSYAVPHQQMLSEENSQSGGLYAALNVPEGHNIYGHKQVVSQNGFSTEQPLYNVLEDLSVKDSEESANNDHQPEPVYNVLEDPYAEVPEEPAWYGSTPVDDPVYNTLEDPDQYTGSELVYNGGPHQSGAGRPDNYGPLDLQDPVYNVLEGPNPESSKNGLNSNSSELEDTINTNIPVYAIVDKTKKTKGPDHDPESSANGLNSNSSEREDTVNTNIPVYAVVDKTKKTKR